jgi:hypothetical protein
MAGDGGEEGQGKRRRRDEDAEGGDGEDGAGAKREEEKGEGEEAAPPVNKNKRYRRDKPWDSEDIDHWKVFRAPQLLPAPFMALRNPASILHFRSTPRSHTMNLARDLRTNVSQRRRSLRPRWSAISPTSCDRIRRGES